MRYLRGRYACGLRQQAEPGWQNADLLHPDWRQRLYAALCWRCHANCNAFIAGRTQATDFPVKNGRRLEWRAPATPSDFCYPCPPTARR